MDWYDPLLIIVFGILPGILTLWRVGRARHHKIFFRHRPTGPGRVRWYYWPGLLLAWLPLALVCWATGHSTAYGWWFWLPFWLIVLLFLISLVPRVSFFKVAFYLGVWLLLVAIFEITNFWPWTSEEHPQGNGARAESCDQRDRDLHDAWSNLRADWAYEEQTAPGTEQRHDAENRVTNDKELLKALQATFQVYCYQRMPNRPTAVLHISRIRGLRVWFDASASKAEGEGNAIVWYQWYLDDINYGNDIGNSLAVYPYDYKAPETADVWVTVEDLYGQQAKSTISTITVPDVYPAPAATASPTCTCRRGATASPAPSGSRHAAAGGKGAVPSHRAHRATSGSGGSNTGATPGTVQGSSGKDAGLSPVHSGLNGRDARVRPNRSSPPPRVIRPSRSPAPYVTQDCDKNGVPDPGCG